MRYIKFTMCVGFSGTEDYEYRVLEDTCTDEELHEIAEGIGYDHAESYEFLATNSIDRNDYETQEEYDEDYNCVIEDYWSNISCFWEEVSEEEYFDYSNCF